MVATTNYGEAHPECNPMPTAALKLGFFTRYVGIDLLEETVALISDQVSHNRLLVFLNCLRSIKDISLQAESSDIGRARLATLNSQLSAFERPALQHAADQLLPLNSPNRCWYDVGRALGDLYLVHVRKTDSRTPSDHRAPENAETARNRLLDAINTVPVSVLPRVRALHDLRSILMQEQTADESLEHALASGNWTDMPIRTDRGDWPTVTRFFDAVLVDIETLRVDPKPRAARHLSEVDKMAYELFFTTNEDKRLSSYKEMLARLKTEFPHTVIKSDGGLRSAALRYHRANPNLPPLPPRKGMR